MKFIIVFLIALTLHGSARSFSQPITLKAIDVSLPDAFVRIEQVSGFYFTYNEKLLKNTGTVTINVENASIQTVLNTLFKGLPISYVLDKNLIILKKKENDAKEIKAVPAALVKGKVVNDNGEPLADITVVVEKDPKIGTSTNQSGDYSLNVPPDAVLAFSGIGYTTLKVPVAGRQVLDVILKPAQAIEEEMVITAFGKKQRKEAVVGSVTSVTPKDLKIPSSNLTTAFAGRIAGVIAYQRNGEPGQDNAQFFIRGITTFGVNNIPLILIDNIELTSTDLARLQPDDIASFSILKDASATALYGARGANGVILVTTKEGKEGAVKVNFRLENSIASPTKTVELTDPVTYMTLYNEAQLSRGSLDIKYSPTQIEQTKAGADPAIYTKTNWQDLLFKKSTSNQRGNFSISGGGKIAQYYVSGTYNRDNGILNVAKENNFNNNIKLNTYLLRSNVNINVTPTTQLVVRLYGTFDDYNGPVDGGSGLYYKSLRTSPSAYPAFYTADSANRFTQHILFGNYDRGQYLNPYADMVKGYKQYSQSRMLAQFELNQKLSFITPGLSFRGIGSTNRYSYFDVSRAYNPYYYSIGLYDAATKIYNLSWLNETADPRPTEYLNYAPGRRDLSSFLYVLGAFDYNRTFKGIHNFSGSLIATMQQTLSPNGATLQLSLPKRNTGVSGRASYNYDNRYFAEVNFGYNGSERFSKDKQFGFFPTVGAAWVISNEDFWHDMVPSITKLKLRGTFGKVGNDAIGNDDQRFFYLSNVNLENSSKGSTFGYNNGYSRNGVSISAYGNSDITWETSYQTNLALEVSLANRINIVAEVYNQKRKNILMPRASVPTTMGLSSLTFANVGQARSRGIDFSLDYVKNFSKDFWMTARGNFTFSTSEFLVYEEPDYKEKYLRHPGQSLAQQWGYVAERLFIDEKDVQNSPKQNFGLYGAGDLKYTDLNADGQITPLDKAPIGHPTSPEIVYGFGFSTKYKSFDLSAFLQGLARETFWIDPVATAPFINYTGTSNDLQLANGVIGENALIRQYAEDHWSEENRNLYALWPRLSVIKSENNAQTSTWFMRDGSFVRLKSLEFGYTLPQRFLKTLKMDNIRIYFSGTNLLTFSQFKMWDPEMGGNGLAYPVQKVFNLGVNINF